MEEAERPPAPSAAVPATFYDARLSRDRELDAAETNAIVAWLKSLTGEIPVKYVERPSLPPSR
jgi:hypothetical protein